MGRGIAQKRFDAIFGNRRGLPGKQPGDRRSVLELDSNGDKMWRSNGQLHREDGPAVEYADGTKEWYKNGRLHREDGPAVEYPSGTKVWYLEGQLHREDGPAFDGVDGTKAWYLKDRLHREDGPAIERPDGTKEWWENGMLLFLADPAFLALLQELDNATRLH